VEASFAIIAPACLLRPHLTAELIALPIDAMVAGGMDDAGAGHRHRPGLRHAQRPYVEPSEAGRRWLTGVAGPGELAGSVFRARLEAALAEDGRATHAALDPKARLR
jgi:hypothetical protein